ncbi:MAG: protein of unknown function, DUF547 [halophilic archaeon J07HX5]|jgi:Protein of unknown function, DUF547.|nr:MAG: protein of unknown function, DUF547 [halophilic archaeon J07HX5]
MEHSVDSTVDQSDEPTMGGSQQAVADDNPVTMSRQLLEGVRREQPVTPHQNAIAALDEADLEPVRTDRATALAFWLNVYNASVQLLLEDRPELFESHRQFFGTDAVTVAGIDLSLDGIEHGILRGNRSKYGLGYLPRLTTTGLGAAYRLEVDPRVHFALNCGAASCPAVLAYEPATVDQTLDDATRSHLTQTVNYDETTGHVRVPRLCLWYLGDFSGPSGILSLLEEYGQLPAGASPPRRALRFDSYDWSKAPRKFADESRTELN